MFEKDAEEYSNSFEWTNDDRVIDYSKQGFQKGAEFGYKKAMEEWKRCFLSCSSPYCSKQFPTVESNGVLGNMEKKENDRV